MNGYVRWSERRLATGLSVLLLLLSSRRTVDITILKIYGMPWPFEPKAFVWIGRALFAPWTMQYRTVCVFHRIQM
jgi:hypothetical protein